MRKAWGCCAFVTIGLCGAAAAPAYARDFPFTVIPASTAAEPDFITIANPAAPARLPLADDVLLIPPDSVQDPNDRYDISRNAPPAHVGVLAAIRHSLHARGSSMHDAYAHGTSGFRLSAGSSFRVDYTAPDYGPAAAAGSAALMQLPTGAVNLRDGYESYAPVALAGYDQALGDRLKIGIEGGAMRGRAATISPVDAMPADIPSDRVGINPVGDVVMTYLF